MHICTFLIIIILLTFFKVLSETNLIRIGSMSVCLPVYLHTRFTRKRLKLLSLNSVKIWGLLVPLHPMHHFALGLEGLPIHAKRRYNIFSTEYGHEVHEM